MDVNVNNKVSNVELEAIKNNLTYYFANLGKKYFNEFRFGVPMCEDSLRIYKELVMYQWVLTDWKQYENGNPKVEENNISLEDFNVMIERIKFLII